MSKVRIAVPSMKPGGLKAKRSSHFGKCEVFTLIDVDNGKVSKTQVLDNVEHGGEGCLVPVRLLADQGVNAILVGGMGRGPLMGFRQAGIDVLIGSGVTVQEAIDGYLADDLEEMPEDYVCRCH